MAPDPEFDVKLWEEAMRYHRALIASGVIAEWQAEMTDDQVLVVAAPILGAHCSADLLQTRIDVARAFAASETVAPALEVPEVSRRDAWKRMLAGWVHFLSRLRPASLREVAHFQGAEGPGLFAAYDDRREHPECRYVAWPSRELLTSLGFKEAESQ